MVAADFSLRAFASELKTDAHVSVCFLIHIKLASSIKPSENATNDGNV